VQKISFNNDTGRTRKKGVSAEDEMLLQWQKELSDEPMGASERTYYKDLDFKSIKDLYSLLTKYYNALERLLQVKPKNKEQYNEIIKMRMALFKKIEETVDRLTFDWVESTASFSGSSTQRQEAYESIIDEVKASIAGCSPPTDKDELEMFMITFKHFVKWLMSESLNYSLGERVDATDPQRYGLEKSKIVAAAGADALSKGQMSDRKKLDTGRSTMFKRSGKTTPPPSGD